MAGNTDPRDEEVTPLEPDFTVTSDSGEVGAIYEITLVSLLETFYADFQNLTPEEMYSTIDAKTDQLYEDMMAVVTAMLPAIVLIGASEALMNILTSIEFEGYSLSNGQKVKLSKFLEKKSKADNSFAEEDQALTIKGIVDEIKNDIKSNSHFIKHRLAKEPKSTVKVGNIIRRAVNRIKKMAVFGIRSSYHVGKDAYFQVVYTKKTMFDWVTAHDKDVCGFCRFFESISPMPYEMMPPCPYHIFCRCDIVPSEVFYFKDRFSDFLDNL